jgi:hypothetical protein
MNIKIMKKIAVILAISAVIGSSLNAQDRNAVIAAYNEGAKLTQSDVPGAISAFEKVITLSDQVGESAADLKQKAVSVLPGLYNKAALNAINEKKPAQETMKAARTASSVAEKYGTATHKENAKKIMLQAYINLANSYFSEYDYTYDLLTFDRIFIVNPGYINAV